MESYLVPLLAASGRVPCLRGFFDEQLLILLKPDEDIGRKQGTRPGETEDGDGMKTRLAGDGQAVAPEPAEELFVGEGFGFILSCCSAAHGFVEFDLAEADRLGGQFDEFVVFDVFQGLFEGEVFGLFDRDGGVFVGGSHVVELFDADGVDFDVVASVVFADDLASVDLGAWGDEHDSAFVEVDDGVFGDLAIGGVDHDAGLAGWAFAGDGDELQECVVHDGLALGGGEDASAHTDEGSGGDFEDAMGDAVASGIHRDEFAFSFADDLHDGADGVIGAVDDEFFEWFALDAFDFAFDDDGAADSELEAFAAHGFEEDAEMEEASA